MPLSSKFANLKTATADVRLVVEHDYEGWAGKLFNMDKSLPGGMHCMWQDKFSSEEEAQFAAIDWAQYYAKDTTTSIVWHQT